MDLKGGNEGNYFCQHVGHIASYSGGFLCEYVHSCVYTNCTCADLFLSEWSGAACGKRINRFSWLDTEGAGTPLTQGQDIPLTGARREEEGERDERERDREKGRFCRDATVLLFFFSLSPHFLTSLPWRLWKGRTERETQSKRDKGGKAERMKANVSAWVTLCVTCSVMLVWLPLPLQPASVTVRKRNVFRRNESLNRFTMWMWDSNFQTFAGRIPRKKEQRPESLAGPAGWAPVSSYCRDSLAWRHFMLGLSLLPVSFFIVSLIGIFISLLELSGFYGAV